MAKVGMGGEGGVSPRKAMAGIGYSVADKGGENFGVESFAAGNRAGADHPDHMAGTGMKEHMADGERAIGEPIHHTKHHHPAQAAPNHGPHHPEGYMHRK